MKQNTDIHKGMVQGKSTATPYNISFEIPDIWILKILRNHDAVFTLWKLVFCFNRETVAK